MFDVWEFYANWRLQIGFFVFELNKFFFKHSRNKMRSLSGTTSHKPGNSLLISQQGSQASITAPITIAPSAVSISLVHKILDLNTFLFRRRRTALKEIDTMFRHNHSFSFDCLSARGLFFSMTHNLSNRKETLYVAIKEYSWKQY